MACVVWLVFLWVRLLRWSERQAWALAAVEGRVLALADAENWVKQGAVITALFCRGLGRLFFARPTGYCNCVEGMCTPTEAGQWVCRPAHFTRDYCLAGLL